MGTSALRSEEILGFKINQIIHLSPPIKGADTKFPLVSPDPPPMDFNREGSHSVVKNLKVVKTGLGQRQTSLGCLAEGSFPIKCNGKRPRGNLVVGN